MHGRDCGAHVHVAHGGLDDGQRVEVGHAALHERAEGAREARDEALADQRAEERQPQVEPVHEAAVTRHPGHQHPVADHEQHDAEHVAPPPRLDVLTEADDGARGPVEVGHAAADRLEDLLELGDHQGEHQQQHAEGDAEHHDGVRHRADDARLDPLALLEEAREPVEDLLLHAAGLAGSHHVGVERVEHAVVLGHGLGERRAGLDVLHELGTDALHRPLRQLALEHAQAARHGDACVQQRRQLARELRQHAGSHAANRTWRPACRGQRASRGRGRGLW